MGSRNDSEEVGSNMLIVPDDYLDGSNEQGDLEFQSRKEIMEGDMGTLMESVSCTATLVHLSGDDRNQRSNSIQNPRGRLCGPNEDSSVCDLNKCNLF